MPELLPKINSPEDLRRLQIVELPRLADEIRREIIAVVSRNHGHLASNLGAVELALALHYCFDFLKDRLVWDVGHQCYTHKLLTGRRERFHTLRQHDGLSGFPDRTESPYDPFTTGHAGTAISSALGLACGDALTGQSRKVVAVVGDGAMGAGMSFEGLNQAGHLRKNILVVLNDNRMAISCTVGALSNYLTAVRSAPLYSDFKKEIHHLLNMVPVFGRRMEEALEHLKAAVKKSMAPGQMFEELGFRYFGPVDGHDIPVLIETLNEVKRAEGPVLLHVVTEKGKGFLPAWQNPTRFHSAKSFQVENGQVIEAEEDPGVSSYTKVASMALADMARSDRRIVAITAAMPDGTGLAAFGKEFPDRFLDVGICEQHALGLAAGLAASGMKPVVAVYSTFLQRAYDQLFHEISLQKTGVVLLVDRAGLVGDDGPTHHGVFDIAYLRHLPGLVLMAPKDGAELRQMLRLALASEAPCAIRYPRANVPMLTLSEPAAAFRIGEAETLRTGLEVAIFAYGAMVQVAAGAAERLAGQGIEAAVINARFAKPLDKAAILDAFTTRRAVITIEDHSLAGGFGSAVLELASDAGADTRKLVRLGIPDQFVEHGARSLLLRNLGLDPEGLQAAVMRLVGQPQPAPKCLATATAG